VQGDDSRADDIPLWAKRIWEGASIRETEVPEFHAVSNGRGDSGAAVVAVVGERGNATDGDMFSCVQHKNCAWSHFLGDFSLISCTSPHRPNKGAE
jgi:hypothetical protein